MKISYRFVATLSVLFLSLSSHVSLAEPEILSDDDKQLFLKKLEHVRESAEKSSKERFLTALEAYRAAIKSDTAAHDLYLKCLEKVDFLDKKKSSQEFRDWKRKHKEKGDSAEFRKALQHQLNWLLLSIEASANPDDMDSLGVRALAKVDAIINDHAKLKNHRKTLKQNVLSSVFAKAYNINGLEAKDWPMSPLQIDKIYEKVVMPPLRKSTKVNSLRGAWKKRIEHKGLMLKNWGKVHTSKRIGMKKEMLPPEFEKWKKEGYLELLWKKEVDCYKAGDEKQSCNNMLNYLSDNIKNKQSLKWTMEFQKLILGDQPEKGDEVEEVTE